MEGQMSEKKGPFDTDFKGIIKNLSWPWYVWVIEELRQEYLCTDKDGKSICLLEKCEDYKSCVGKPFIQAIRILEVAGKVDRENALWNIDEAFSQGRGHVEMMAPYRADHNLENYNRADKEITALLESLPKPEQEKE
jgi:hypothetical protein